MAMDNFEQADISGIDVCLTDSLPREMNQIEAYQERLDQAYRNIGKLYAKLHWHSAEPIMLPYLNTVAECTSAIDNIKRKQADSRNNMFCPACGAHIPSTSLFCPRCGRNIKNFMHAAAGAAGAAAGAAASAAAASSPSWQSSGAAQGAHETPYASSIPAGVAEASQADAMAGPSSSAPGTAPGNDQYTDVIHQVISIDDGTCDISHATHDVDEATTVIGANATDDASQAFDQNDPANLTNVIDLVDFENGGENKNSAQAAANAQAQNA